MDGQEFYTELDKIIKETNQKIVSLVHKAQEENGLNWDTDLPLPFADDPNIERRADDLACMGGWVHDRINGRNRLSKKSITKKIRKALGYSYP
jgi:hypothetical protein